ncbi:MAG: hypothetical protein ONB27_00630 [candidate division KSB1 bacterium]|nr:hypothetical protein [candidate division KSB1 bacterium]
MTSAEYFEQMLTPEERRMMANLNAPGDIQQFLDSVPYSADPFYRCPLRVLRDRIAHCFDGAVFAAAALQRIGFPPLILELLPNDRDDDHLIAPFKIDGHWGALAKSNFVGLRFREPVYRNLRELVMSYFEHYYNTAREKTLRGYALPLNLATLDRYHWLTDDATMDRIATQLDRRRKIPLITPAMSARLLLVDERSYLAELSGANEAGLFQPD